MKRQCAECGGELVMAINPGHNSESTPRTANPLKVARWRCGTCGHSFTFAELRLDKAFTQDSSNKLS
jgi:hypothetical protein